MRLNQFRWRRRIMVGAYSLSDPVQLIQINFWSGTETAGEFVPMLGGGGTIKTMRHRAQAAAGLSVPSTETTIRIRMASAASAATLCRRARTSCTGSPLSKARPRRGTSVQRCNAPRPSMPPNRASFTSSRFPYVLWSSVDNDHAVRSP